MVENMHGRTDFPLHMYWQKGNQESVQHYKQPIEDIKVVVCIARVSWSHSPIHDH